MDENTEVMTSEATMPAEDTTATAGAPADTTAAGAPDAPAEVTMPAGEEEPPAAREPVPVTVPVKFRHESRELTLEEAANYAQMGMKLQSLQPTMDKLRMMAAGHGQSLTAFVDAWAAAEERATMERLLQQAGGDRDVAERLLRLEREDRQKACHIRDQQESPDASQENAALTTRLVSQFGELRQAFPEVVDFDRIPDGVLADAVQNDRHLLDAYLRYEHGERLKIQQNREVQQTAAGASAGSQADHPAGEEKDALTEIMRRSIQSVFN